MIALLLSVVFAALPRFATIKTDKANSHVGPGKNFPIKWCYVRKYMPVEIIGEFDTWRKIKDFDGSQSWMHQSLLSGKRYVLIVKTADLYKNSIDDGMPIAVVKKNVICQLLSCQKSFCKIKAAKYKGWLKKDCIWGIYANENSK